MARQTLSGGLTTFVKKIPRIYYGWVVVAAAVIIYTAIMGATYGTYGLYVLPVSQFFNLSRADTVKGLIIVNIGMAIQAPFIGMLLDRISAKYVLIASGLSFICSFTILALSHSLLLDVAVLALLVSFAFQGAGPLTLPLLIVRWFTSYRARAMAVSELGYSGGAFLLSPIVGALIVSRGWHETLLITGVATGALIFTIGAAIRERPAKTEREVEGSSAVRSREQSRERSPNRLKVGAILRTSQFWTINLSCGLVAAMAATMLITLAPLGISRGLTVIQAAILVSVMAAFGILAKVLFAVVGDHIDKVMLLTVLFFLGSVADIVLMLAHSYVPLLLGVATVGLAHGVTSPGQYVLIADRFGSASYGTVTGLAIPLNSVLGMLAIWYSGKIYDRTGSYKDLLVAFIMLQIVAAAVILITRFTPAQALTSARSA